MSEPRPGEINVLARLVKERYIALRRSQFPKYRPDARRWASVWERAGRVCFDAKVSPEKLVLLAFNVYRPFPHPSQLLSRRLQRYLTRLDAGLTISTEAEDALRYRLEIDELQAQLLSGRELAEVLLDNDLHLGSLFRYAVAVVGGCEGVASVLRKTAITERRLRSGAYLKLLPSGGLMGLS